jgi:diguanylate cyclase (GGDEF)-like protein/PAS domain S-box-containing protein
VIGGAPGQLLRLGEIVRVPTGDVVVLLGRDVTAERAADRALAASEERYRRLVEHSSDPIVVVGADGHITYASPAVRSVLHHDPDALVGRRVCSITHPEDAAACAELVARAAEEPAGGSRMANLRTVHPGGEVGWVSVTVTNWLDGDAVGGLVLNIRDVTDQRAAEERLQREALQDALTGLPNRRWFLRALADAAARTARTGAPFAVLLLDIDDFKSVNDTLGHAAGDTLLTELAQRLSAALRPSDAAARLGGDEFVVLTQDLRSPEDAAAVARRILERCTGIYGLGEVGASVSVSIGVATTDDLHAHDRAAGPGGRVDPQRVLSLADAALYEAKRRGRHQVHVGGPGTTRSG